MYDANTDQALCNECGHDAEDHESNPDGLHGSCYIRDRYTGQPCDCGITQEEVYATVTNAILCESGVLTK